MKKISLSDFTIRLVLIIFLIYTLFPLYIAISASLKTGFELFSDPLGLPNPPAFKNYFRAFVETGLGRAYLNSAILSLGTDLGILLTAIPISYALAKMSFQGKNFLIGYFFFCTTIPPQLFIVPLYFMFSRLGLVNSLFGLIIIYIAMFTPFSTLLMRSYFVKVPNELLEAALIDGASKWKAFWKVVFPVARPGITTTLLIVTMWSWNNLLLPLTFVNDEKLKPVTVAVAMLEGKWSSSWEIIMAASILASLPIIILFIFSHRNFVEGLAGTGLKG